MTCLSACWWWRVSLGGALARGRMWFSDLGKVGGILFLSRAQYCCDISTLIYHLRSGFPLQVLLLVARGCAVAGEYAWMGWGWWW